MICRPGIHPAMRCSPYLRCHGSRRTHGRSATCDAGLSCLEHVPVRPAPAHEALPISASMPDGSTLWGLLWHAMRVRQGDHSPHAYPHRYICMSFENTRGLVQRPHPLRAHLVTSVRLRRSPAARICSPDGVVAHGAHPCEDHPTGSLIYMCLNAEKGPQRLLRTLRHPISHAPSISPG